MKTELVELTNKTNPRFGFSVTIRWSAASRSDQRTAPTKPNLAEDPMNILSKPTNP